MTDNGLTPEKILAAKVPLEKIVGYLIEAREALDKFDGNNTNLTLKYRYGKRLLKMEDEIRSMQFVLENWEY